MRWYLCAQATRHTILANQPVRRCLGWLGRQIGTRARACIAASAAGLGILGWPTPASGAPFELTWTAPEGCPAREEIVTATHVRLGDGQTEGPAELFVQGTAVPADEGFVVTLVLKDAGGRAVGERVVRIDQQRCAEILTPTSVVLAMMIAVARPRGVQSDEHGGMEEGRATPEQASPMPSAAPRVVADRRGMPAPPEPPVPDRLALGAVAMVSAGLLPGLGLGFGLQASYFPKNVFLLRLEASVEAGETVRVAGGDVAFRLFSAAARAGLRVMQTKRFELLPTVVARAGLIDTSAEGFAARLDDAKLVGSVGPGVLVRVGLGSSLALEGLLDAELILRRDRFHVLQGGRLHRVHEPGVASGRLTLGLAYEFR